MVVARWMTDGEPRCTIGRVSSVYGGVMNKLDGRIGQVVQDFSLLESKSKLDASSESDGILLVAIVVNYKKGDKELVEAWSSREWVFPYISSVQKYLFKWDSKWFESNNN